MEKIKIFKHLVRLSQIAEELQDENPEVSEKLTNFIDETADDIAPGADSPEVDQDMFPPIETPNIDEDVIEDKAKDNTKQKASEIAEEIVSSPEFGQVIEKIVNTEDSDDQKAVMDLANILREALEG